MSHNIYNVFPSITLQSGLKIYLQTISFTHTYAGLLCGSPREQINHNILLEIHEEFEEGLFIVEPKVILVNDNDFFKRSVPSQDNEKQTPLMPPVKVYALFECYNGEATTYLNIVWFQNEYSVTITTYIEDVIKKLDWDKYACEFDL